MSNVTVTVTDADIRAGLAAALSPSRSMGAQCPLAVALRRDHHHAAIVGMGHWRIGDGPSAALPGEAALFVARFDTWSTEVRAALDSVPSEDMDATIATVEKKVPRPEAGTFTLPAVPS